MIEIEQAFELLLNRVAQLPTEIVNLKDSVGRVLAQSVNADIDSPPHRKSLMDGFAIRSSDFQSGCRQFCVVETIMAGGWPRNRIDTGKAARVMTGAPLPEGADAVVMIEKVEMKRIGASGTISLADTGSENHDSMFIKVLIDQLPPNQHVSQQASNFRLGQSLFEPGHRIRFSDIGLLAEAGATQLCVGKRPEIAILPTGNELVDSATRPGRGQIRNSNGPMLAAMVERMGLKATRMPICGDDEDELERAMVEGLKSDLLVLTGGVSEGLLDLVPRTLTRLGVEEVFHKVRIKPGKPIWFGVKSQGDDPTDFSVRSIGEAQLPTKSVFGLPGNPVSSLVGFELFVKTAIRLLEGESSPHTSEAVAVSNHPALPRFQMALLTKDHASHGDRPTYWPGRLPCDTSSLRTVEPLDWKGSSDLLSLARADGLIYFSGREGIYKSGTEVPFIPL
jgi:molybdopterin molybdotransferase